MAQSGLGVRVIPPLIDGQELSPRVAVLLTAALLYGSGYLARRWAMPKLAIVVYMIGIAMVSIALRSDSDPLL